MSCCDETKHLVQYQTVTPNVWAACCKKCGRAWVLKSKSSDIPVMKATP